MIKTKYLALALELIGIAGICYAVYLFFNLAACLAACSVAMLLIGAALENSK